MKICLAARAAGSEFRSARFHKGVLRRLTPESCSTAGRVVRRLGSRPSAPPSAGLQNGRNGLSAFSAICSGRLRDVPLKQEISCHPAAQLIKVRVHVCFCYCCSFAKQAEQVGGAFVRPPNPPPPSSVSLNGDQSGLPQELPPPPTPSPRMLWLLTEQACIHQLTPAHRTHWRSGERGRVVFLRRCVRWNARGRMKPPSQASHLCARRGRVQMPSPLLPARSHPTDVQPSVVAHPVPALVGHWPVWEWCWQFWQAAVGMDGHLRCVVQERVGLLT
ncbi:hypothetical protein COCON_G00165920 [Conger conger]|uniref:Uncharacterized protein n=1 Tax=Conger conger TaxID=82655 RepID=A0A9Q1HT83_CONCO|nr:hypothetical protein COCON_G00165920 [Conger conger]